MSSMSKVQILALVLSYIEQSSFKRISSRITEENEQDSENQSIDALEAVPERSENNTKKNGVSTDSCTKFELKHFIFSH